MRISRGHQIYQWVTDLFPICRSLTGPGVRETLAYIGERVPELKIHEVPSGTQAFDWTVPDEWTIRDAFIADESGNRVVDFRQHNLHVVGYSEPVDSWMSLDDLESHLYSLPDQPDAIPYVTSYYNRRWGFCLAHKQRQAWKPGRYHAFIDADLKPGLLNYGEAILPGESGKEVFLSTYICHPSMANNELSGPAVVMALAQWIAQEPRRYTYRIIFIPERIGSLVYLAKNMEHLKEHVIAGFNVTCVGDDRAYSYLPSRYGNTLADKVAVKILSDRHPDFIRYTYLDRGSDEIQYCAPGCDLPVCSIMRTKYGKYPEYHTSLDDLTVVTPSGLQGALDVYKACIQALEANSVFKMRIMMEPQLGQRGLYPTISQKGARNDSVRTMTTFVAYADGTNDLIDISNIIGAPLTDIYTIVKQLNSNNLIVRVSR